MHHFPVNPLCLGHTMCLNLNTIKYLYMHANPLNLYDVL